MTASSHSTGDDARLAARLEPLTRWRAVTHLAAALVEDGGSRVTFAGRDADERSDFEIGSITKGLTGLLLADSVERGEVQLETTLGELLELGGSRAARVCLGALATHSSGLPGLPRSLAWRATWDFLRGRNPYREVSEDAVVDALRGTRAGRPSPRYSNFGFSALGLALASAARTSFPELVRSRIFSPLGMGDSYLPASDPELRQGALTGHSARGVPRDAWTMTGVAPAGGVRSTASDMARLVAALLGGTAPGMAAIEPRAEFSRGTRIGLAWLSSTTPSGRELTWHNGMTGGFSSILVLDRAARRGAVVLNASSRIIDDVGRGLLDTVPDAQP